MQSRKNRVWKQPSFSRRSGFLLLDKDLIQDISHCSCQQSTKSCGKCCDSSSIQIPQVVNLMVTLNVSKTHKSRNVANTDLKL
ncbi:unnamed protein product [Caenorhabditis angaria]|uniref:Uncharacterized protein n=1 Tax=Caenorhabditis angaria TaxID=860376 RepID=A0A9P1J0F3_9PELO|nr:unnamed protein product [Caenorhabditis angaria]